jgi:hypothetical protein
MENKPFIPGSDKLTVQSALVNLEDLGKINKVAPKPTIAKDNNQPKNVE